MAVEIDGFEMVQGPVENGAEGDKSVSREIGKLEQAQGDGEAIKFGSHGDESAKAEGNGVSDSNVPKNVVEEWPAPQQMHLFYFVRNRPYDDPNIKSKVDKLDNEINQKNKERFQVIQALKAKRSERAELISQIKSLRDENRKFQSVFDEKLKEIEPLQQALGKLRTANNSGRGGLCSSEKELNDIINSLQYRIQHESIPLSEEKQILREIKQLEGTREKVIANAAMRAKVQDSIGQKEDIQDAVKLIGGNLDEMKKERQTIRSKIKQLDDALKAIDKDIQSLQEDLAAVTQKREKAFESIRQLRKQRDEGNTNFYQSQTFFNKALQLAGKKDISALKELSQTEVEKFNSLWSSGKAFRDDYEKRVLPSLDARRLSRDGRMRSKDEKPLLEESKPTETETLPKSSVKQPKEEPKPSPQEALPTQKVQKETKNDGRDLKSDLGNKEEPKPSPQEALPTQKVQKETKNEGRDLKSDLGNKDLEDADEYEFEKPQKEIPTKEPAIDPAKLKEMKKQEEIEKAKEALERKRKSAEKAAAKAAIRAQKKAEKKLKEREKKAKKAAAVPNPEEPANEVAGEATEQEKLNDTIEAAAPVVKEKVLKESSIRSRKEKVLKESSNRSKKRTKGPDSIPKAILKRKRSNNYWVWVASCALLVLILLVLGYIYLL